MWRKPGLIIFIFLCSHVSTFARYPIRAQVQLGNFFSPSFYGNNFSVPIKVAGVSLQYRFKNKLGIKAGYQQWLNPFGSSVAGKPFDMAVMNKQGMIDTRWNYTSFDLAGIYSLTSKKHELYFSCGPVATYGKNYVITAIYQEPGYPDKLFSGETRNASYFGIMWEIGYNRMLYRERMNIGFSFGSRNYFGAFIQYGLNLNFGYNFQPKPTTKSQ